jgi:ribosomal protein S12 methylthiotransferase
VRETRFERVGAFAFSPQEGTPAAALGARVEPAVVEERIARLREAADEIALEAHSAKIGRAVEVLVEGRDHAGRLFGRTEADAPEVDGLVLLTGDATPGEFVPALVTGATPHDLIATVARADAGGAKSDRGAAAAPGAAPSAAPAAASPFAPRAMPAAASAPIRFAAGRRA